MAATGGATGGASPGRRGRGRGGAGPWGPIVDAAHTVAARFSDPVGMTGVNAMDAAPEAIEAVGRAFQKVGKTIADEVDWDPKVGPFFERLGDMILRAEKPARDGAAAVRRAEADRIRNVEEATARRRRWDISAHDGR